jgi:hypothetical protein
VVAAAVLAVVTIGIWALAPQDDIQATPIAAGPAAAPTPLPVELHVVELQGLPAGSTILLDGKAAVGPHVELPAGESTKHTIQVLAPGKLPWFVVHGAGSQHRYDVAMTAATSETVVAPTPITANTKTARAKTIRTATPHITTPTRPQVASTPPPSTNTKTAPRRTTKNQTAPPTAFRDLDF